MAQAELGVFLINSIQTDEETDNVELLKLPEVQEAVEWLRKAAEQGHKEAREMVESLTGESNK